tara:strand:- start:1596 stop:1805 length:210 start_codon:yes stop_codon:yes gene_type:complete
MADKDESRFPVGGHYVGKVEDQEECQNVNISGRKTKARLELNEKEVRRSSLHDGANKNGGIICHIRMGK